MLSYLLWLSSEVKTMSSDREKKRLVLRLVFTTSGSSDLTETFTRSVLFVEVVLQNRAKIGKRVVVCYKHHVTLCSFPYNIYATALPFNSYVPLPFSKMA